MRKKAAHSFAIHRATAPDHQAAAGKTPYEIDSLVVELHWSELPNDWVTSTVSSKPNWPECGELLVVDRAN